MGFQARIKNKRDTSANWTSNNPVILDGEIILVDTADGGLRAKVGDGVKTYTQLPFYDEALRNIIDSKSGVAIGTCATTASTAEKVVTITGNTNWKLEAGSVVIVKFSNTNTASNPKLNVNGTGAKPVFYGTSVIATGNLNYAGYSNRYIEYVYDGTNFVFVGWSYDQNSTYSNATLGNGYATCTTEESTTAKIATLSGYSLITGGSVSVKFSNAVPASSTLNINSRGAKSIYYHGSAITDGVINAGDIATFVYSENYHLISIDRLSDATGSKSGYMSASDKSKLDGIADGANKITVDSALSSTSTNPVQNKVVNSALSGKANATHTHAAGDVTGLSTVATSGKYSDLSGTPTIPTKTSQLTNDSGFKTTDNNTTYTLTKSGSTITLTGSDGQTTSVTDSDNNTTYSAATTSAAGLMSAADKTKLDGIETNANKYSLPTASSSVLGGVKVGAGLAISDGVLSATGGGTADAVEWSNVLNKTNASTSAAGLMSSSDKSKLDGIATGANNYTHPTSSGNKHIPSGGSAGKILRWSADGTAVWGDDHDTTYSAATTSTAGLMSASDKIKLDGIATGANKTTVDTALSDTSTNPVQNKVIAAALSNLTSPAPWAFSYNSAGDVLGLERSVSSHSVTDSVTPYNVKSSVSLTDADNAYNNKDNTTYALMGTTTTARTVTIYIDTEIPSVKTISSMSVSFKVGTSNISSAVWTTRSYTVKCGGNTIGSGNFNLSTNGSIVTVTVSDVSKITSPIIEITLTAVTTSAQNMKIYGAQVDVTYTSTKEFVSIIRQNMLAIGTHSHSKYATTDYVDNATGFDP